jgi:hypothetical protein
VVKAEDSQLSGCGFKSRRRLLDGVSKASYYIGKRNKGSQMGGKRWDVRLDCVCQFKTDYVRLVERLVIEKKSLFISVRERENLKSKIEQNINRT